MIIPIILCYLSVQAQATDHEKRLITNLFNQSTYDKRVHPAPIDQNGKFLPLNVSITFRLADIVGVEEQRETITVLAYVWESWLDQSLSWDPDDYGGISQITVSVKDIWAPDIYLQNTFVMNNDDKASRIYALIRMIADPMNTTRMTAQIMLAYEAIMQERCPVRMQLYPFDRQTCQLCIGTAVSTISQIIYRTTPEVKDSSHSAEGGNWMLVHAIGVDNIYHGWDHMNYSGACINLTIQRRSLFYVINVFVPVTTICLLNTIGLFSRVDDTHGQLDIASLGQTTLLSLGVILLTVADQTPKGSAVVSLLSIFFIVMIIQILLATCTSIYLLNSHKRQQRQYSRIHSDQRKSGVHALKPGITKNIHWENVCMIVNLVFISVVTVSVIAIGYISRMEL